jgi:ribosomal protein S18 acetylase RimI-like enzyme
MQAAADKGEVVYRDLEIGDLPAAAALHREVFADYFLGHMGQRFLELFYGEFVGRPGTYTVAAVDGGSVVGTVIGATDLSKVFSDFYRRHFLALAWQVMVRFLRDGYVRGHVRSRLPHVGRAVKSRLGIARPAAATAAAAEWPQAQLLSIGVAASQRGTSVAAELMTRFCDRMAADGVDAVGLSVFEDNPRAIAFYERMGWTRGENSGGSATFYRRLSGSA